MSNHEQKTCPRCHQLHECKQGNITQCHCFGAVLTDELKAWLEYKYTDCLCYTCLQEIHVEFELFKEKMIFR